MILALTRGSREDVEKGLDSEKYFDCRINRLYQWTGCIT